MYDTLNVHVGNGGAELSRNMGSTPFRVRKTTVEVATGTELHDNVELFLVFEHFESLLTKFVSMMHSKTRQECPEHILP